MYYVYIQHHAYVHIYIFTYVYIWKLLTLLSQKRTRFVTIFFLRCMRIPFQSSLQNFRKIVSAVLEILVTRTGPTLVNVFKAQPNPVHPNFENPNPTQPKFFLHKPGPAQPDPTRLFNPKNSRKIIRPNISKIESNRNLFRIFF